MGLYNVRKSSVKIFSITTVKKLRQRCKIVYTQCTTLYNSPTHNRGIGMLRKFRVENFKGFMGRFMLDLSRPGNYEFGSDCIRNGIVDKCAIYGINGIGKSNFGLAIFDLVNHLTENSKEIEKYTKNYLNLDGFKPFAYFEYEFQFDDSILVYKYSKSAVNALVEESLSINDKEMLFYDFRNQKGFSSFAGSESLNLESSSPNSRVKYILSTAVLSDGNKENEVLQKFKDFVNNMLLFYSLRTNGFIGYKQGGGLIEKLIIEAGKLKDFEDFLNGQGLHVRLVSLDTPEGKRIYFQHKNGVMHYFTECSTGMESLILLYSWLIELDKCSFVYIDEFDAFYHYEMADLIVRKLKEFKNTQIIVTTHNTDLMSNDLLRPDCYFVLTGEKIDSLNHLTEKDLRQAHNLQKMFKAGAFTE